MTVIAWYCLLIGGFTLLVWPCSRLFVIFDSMGAAESSARQLERFLLQAPVLAFLSVAVYTVGIGLRRRRSWARWLALPIFLTPIVVGAVMILGLIRPAIPMPLLMLHLMILAAGVVYLALPRTGRALAQLDAERGVAGKAAARAWWINILVVVIAILAVTGSFLLASFWYVQNLGETWSVSGLVATSISTLIILCLLALCWNPGRHWGVALLGSGILLVAIGILIPGPLLSGQLGAWIQAEGELGNPMMTIAAVKAGFHALLAGGLFLLVAINLIMRRPVPAGAIDTSSAVAAGAVGLIGASGHLLLQSFFSEGPEEFLMILFWLYPFVAVILPVRLLDGSQPVTSGPGPDS